MFRAVAGAVLGNTELYAEVRKQCADFMEHERVFFTPYVILVSNDNVLLRNFDEHISMLRQDAAWGGDPEITALSGVFNCFFEVYKSSENPDIVYFPNVIPTTNPTVRLYYSHNHYSIVRSDGVGNQLFNFEGLEEGELERQMEILSSSKVGKTKSELEVLSFADKKKYLKKLSLQIFKAEENYIQFYASRIIKPNPNEQN